MKFIIVEGANGVGKSTFVSKLKDKLPNCGILKLTGLPGDTETAFYKTKLYHNSVYNFMLSVKDLPGYMILDRCYLSEQVMATLYKGWTFEDESKYYNRMIEIQGLEVTYVFLWASVEEFRERLKRDKVTYNDISYKANSSIAQQDKYREIYEKFPRGLDAIWLHNEGDVDKVTNYAINSMLLLHWDKKIGVKIDNNYLLTTVKTQILWYNWRGDI